MLMAFVLAVLALLAFVLARMLRAESGLPAGRVVYSDTGAWERNERSFISHAHGLVGKPDYLVQEGNHIVPVEIKSGPAPRDGQPREGHVLQALAYCLLVEEHLGQPAPRAIIKYADRQYAISNTPAARAELLRVIDEMRSALDVGDAPRDHDEPWRCAQCGVRHACDERLC